VITADVIIVFKKVTLTSRSQTSQYAVFGISINKLMPLINRRFTAIRAIHLQPTIWEFRFYESRERVTNLFNLAMCYVNITFLAV
jgi:hypothetical protein